MVRWLGILVGTLRSIVRTRWELALENLALRQQLAVWKARQLRAALGADRERLGLVIAIHCADHVVGRQGSARRRSS